VEFYVAFPMHGHWAQPKMKLKQVNQGASQVVTWSTGHTVKWCDEMTVVSDGVVTS